MRRLIKSAAVDSEQKTFIVLSEDEYRLLRAKDKAAYLVRAQQELAASQQLLRRLTEELRKEQFVLRPASGSTQ